MASQQAQPTQVMHVSHLSARR